MCVMPVAPHIVSGVIRHTLRPLPCLAEAFEVFGLHSIKSDITSAEVHFKYADVTPIQETHRTSVVHVQTHCTEAPSTDNIYSVTLTITTIQ